MCGFAFFRRCRRKGRSARVAVSVAPRRSPALLAEWKKETETLGAGFAAGDAAVDPKRDLKTCLRCDLQTLCRVYEKFNVLEEVEEEDAAE